MIEVEELGSASEGVNRICKWLTVAVLRQSVVDVVTDHTREGGAHEHSSRSQIV